MTRILLADDQEVVRRALRLLLEEELSCVIAGEVQDASSLEAAVKRVAPDLVLLDWELPGLRTEQLLPLANRQGLPIQVIAMSSRPEAQTAAVSAGVDACISKGKPAEEVLATIYEVVGQEV
jgi:DNA-binding NarL/FixJ family response regulator